MISLSSAASDPAFWASAVVLVAAFFALAPRYPALKQRAWLLTALSSAAMSLSSLPLLLHYARARGRLDLILIPVPAAAADAVCRFFQAYLFVDLAVGMLFYRSKVNLLTGWIHHTVYVFVVEYAIQGRWSHIFCLAAVMEIPTFVLAIGSIHPRLRSDVVFALSFFSTRIAFHIALCATLFVQRRQVTNGSLGPALIMALIFPLHAHWFTGCIKGFIKRAKTDNAAPPAKPASTVASPERPVTPRISTAPFHASRASFARRRTAIRMAVRARWDQLGLWKASGRLREMQRRVRAALPGRDRVYQYVGYSISDPSLSDQLQVPEAPRDTVSSFS